MDTTARLSSAHTVRAKPESSNIRTILAFSSIHGPLPAIIVAILLTLFIYWPVLFSGWFPVDDTYELALFEGVGALEGLKSIWTNSVVFHDRPVPLTVLWAIFHTTGVSPIWYHLLSVFIHVACLMMLLVVLRSVSLSGAHLAIIFCAVHPVFVQTVAWTHQVRFLFGAFFFLAAFYCAIKLVQTSSNRWLVASLFLQILAYLSKSSTLAFVPCFLLTGLLFRFKPTRQLVVFLILSTGFGLILGLLDFSLLLNEWDDPVFTLGQRLFLAFTTPIKHIRNVLVPYPMLFDYPLGLSLVDGVAAGGVAAWILYCWVRGRKNREHIVALLVLLLFLAAISPYLAVPKRLWPSGQARDRYQYFATMVPLAYVAYLLIRTRSSPKRWLRTGTLVAATGLVVIWTSLARYSAHDYVDPEKYFQRTFRYAPNAPQVKRVLSMYKSYRERDAYVDSLILSAEVNLEDAAVRVARTFLNPFLNLTPNPKALMARLNGASDGPLWVDDRHRKVILTAHFVARSGRPQRAIELLRSAAKTEHHPEIVECLGMLENGRSCFSAH